MSASKGVWLIAGTSTSEPYPCRCEARRSCSPKFCPCSGRIDLVNVPASCCAHVHTPAVAAAAQDDGWRRVPRVPSRSTDFDGTE